MHILIIKRIAYGASRRRRLAHQSSCEMFSFFSFIRRENLESISDQESMSLMNRKASEQHVFELSESTTGDSRNVNIGVDRYKGLVNCKQDSN